MCVATMSASQSRLYSLVSVQPGKCTAWLLYCKACDDNAILATLYHTSVTVRVPMAWLATVTLTSKGAYYSIC